MERFQLNQATNQFDLSQLYGIDDNVTKELRSGKDGKLMTSTRDGFNNSFLPLAAEDEYEDFCLTDAKICYKSGKHIILCCACYEIRQVIGFPW